MSEEPEIEPGLDFPLSTNPKPQEPRPPMTFEQQAELLEYLHGKMSPMEDGRKALTVTLFLEQPLVDDLWLTAQRLRRMAPHESEIKYVVTHK